MGLPEQLKDTVVSLLRNPDFARTVALVRYSAREVTGPKSDPTYGPAPRQNIRVVDYEEDVKNVSGLVVGTVRKMLVSPEAGVTPAKSDKVDVDSTEYDIERLKAISAGGRIIAWELELKS